MNGLPCKVTRPTSAYFNKTLHFFLSSSSSSSLSYLC